jgi:glycosyltransferase involved in cell wall biosynthesis
MKVLQVNKLYYPWVGGVEKVVQDIAEGLKNKVDTDVLVCQSKGEGITEVINGVKVHRAVSLGICLSMPVSFKLPFMLRKLSKGRDILHFHMPFPLAVISYLLMRPEGRVIVWWHSDIVRQKKCLRLYKPFLMSFLKKVDRIIVATPEAIESSVFLKKFRNKCALIPYGIDLKRFRPNAEIQEKAVSIRRKYGPRLVLFVGRLIYYKGLDYLIKSMQQIDAALLLIGDGPLRSHLKNLAADLGIEDKIVFLQGISDEELPAYYHACDLFVLPSIARAEAFGIVQLEAMACGKPVINTALPNGVPHVSVNGQTGITVAPADTAGLAAAIDELLTNNDLREGYGRNAFRRVQDHFSKEQMLERIYRVYENVLSPKHADSTSNADFKRPLGRVSAQQPQKQPPRISEAAVYEGRTRNERRFAVHKDRV